MKEQVEISLGANTSEAEKALTGFVDKTKKILHPIKEFFGTTIGGFLGAQGLERAFDFVKEKFSVVLNDVERIKNASEALGISASFEQDIGTISKLTNIAGDEFDAMLGKFEKTLPVGSDVEEEFYKMADRIKGIADPSSRAREALEAFGKTGIRLIPILSQGSKELKELAKSFSKYSDADLEALSNAKENIEKLEHQTTVSIGKMIGKVSSFLSAMKLYGEKKGVGFTGALDTLLFDPKAGEKFAEVMAAQIKTVDKVTEAEKKLAREKYKQLQIQVELYDSYQKLGEKLDDLIDKNKYDNSGIQDKIDIIDKKLIPLEEENKKILEEEKLLLKGINLMKNEGVNPLVEENKLATLRIKYTENLINKETLLNEKRKNGVEQAKAIKDLEKDSIEFQDNFKRTEKEAAGGGDSAANKAQSFRDSAEQKRLKGDEIGAKQDLEKASQLDQGTYVEGANKSAYDYSMSKANNLNLPAGFRNHHRDIANSLREGVGSLKQSEINKDPFVMFQKSLADYNEKMLKAFTNDGIVVKSVTFANEKK